MVDDDTSLRDLLQSGYRYALSLTSDEADAEDLVQEAWLKVYTKKGRRIDRPLLFAAIRNLHIDHYRRRRLVIYEPFDETVHTNDPPLTDEEITSEDLDDALNKLRDDEREAIYLNVVEGYTAREISRLTDRPRGTILSLIHRGRQRLAARLGILVERRKRNSA